MAKEFGSVSKFVDFQLVNVMILLGEHFIEFGGVEVRVQQAESLGQQTVEAQVGALLCAALQDHVA